jgi:hypothetical protein
MWLGALLVSIVVVPFGPGIVFENAHTLRSDHGVEAVAIFSMFVASTMLVVWCDVALVMEALRRKHDQWARGSLDWVAWIVAVILSVWCVLGGVRNVRAYRRLGGLGLDTILTSVGFVAVILFFDLALIVHAVKSRRTE